MSSMKCTQVHFEIMLDFMERNENLCNVPNGVQGRLENLQKWIELCDILNTKFKEHAKPLEKWKKAFSDFKNNTKKKMDRINKHGGKTADLTDVEKRVVKLLRTKQGLKRKARKSDENGVIFKEEPDDSPTENYFSTIDNQTLRRNSSVCSSGHSSSASSSLKSEKREDNASIVEIADKFLQFEKERERMAHEREMARIKQNDQFLNVMGRIVNVLETLAPSIQNYFDRNVNEDG